MKKRINPKNISSIAVIICMAVLIILNYDAYVSVGKAFFNWEASDENTTDDLKDNISDLMRRDFVCHDSFIDLYGFTQNALGDNIVGNYDFIRDEAGVMQYPYTTAYTPKNDRFLTSMEELAEVVQEKDIPCVYIELPDRGATFSASDMLDYWLMVDKYTTEKIEQMGFDIIHMDEQSEDCNEIFRTDGHFPTRTEFNMAKAVTQYLTEAYEIAFPQTEVVYNYDNYTWEDNEFIGFNGLSSGKYFTEPDNFEIFTPKFETSLRLTFPVDNTVKTGDFSEVMTNDEINVMMNHNKEYLLLKYGNLSSPYYYYDNLTVEDGPSLLVLSDSMFMRGFTFLTLNSSRVTVLDPRCFGWSEYLAQCLNENYYDSIIIVQSSYFDNVFFRSKSEDNLWHGAEYSDANFDGNNLTVNVKNTSDFDWARFKNTNCMLRADDKDTGERAYIPDDVVVAVGEKITFVFENVGNIISNAETVDVMMLSEGHCYFEQYLRIKGEMPEAKQMDAEIVAYDIPESLFAERATSFSVTVKNTGNKFWSENEMYRLGLFFNGNYSGICAYIPEGQIVVPGEEITFEFEDVFLMEGITVGFMMLKEPYEYFGTLRNIKNQIQHLDAGPLVSPGYEIVSEQLPEDLYNGTPCNFNVTVKNTGGSAWSENDLVRLGVFLDGSDSGLRAYITNGSVVSPGDVYTFYFNNCAISPGMSVKFVMMQEGYMYFEQ